jgi:hypothetical protein
MLDRLRVFDVSMFFADSWEVYAELIPGEFLVQTKAQTMGWSVMFFVRGIGLVVFAEKRAWFRGVNKWLTSQCLYLLAFA